jgi:hypothetical protein
MRNSLKYFCFIVVLACSSCRNNPLDVDVSGIKIQPVKIGRFEKDLFRKPFDGALMRTKYGDFYKGFAETILCPNGMNDPGCPGGIMSYVNDRDVQSAFADCEKEFPEMNDFEEKLEDVFRHFRYHFPNKPLPAVNTMMSFFNYSMLRLDKTIGIGLEMYLGPGCNYYTRLQYPLYKTANMGKAHMLPDFVKAWMLTEFEEKNSQPDFLTRIVDEGKIAYLVDALLPSMDDTLKIGFTRHQLEWCKENEGHVWSFFIKRRYLYSTDSQIITQFTNDGPFTTGFSKESPARTGSWIGWQIVRSYMSKNRKVSLQELMELKDAQKILAASGYKPKL